MPWTVADALRHTKAAGSECAKERWAKTANAVLEKTGDEGRAIRIANAAVKGGEMACKKGKKRKK